MLPADFWDRDENHIAVNPHHPEQAAGLAEFAAAQGLSRQCFFQTSGSEGRPKWVGLSKEAFLTSAAAVNQHFEVTAADRWLIALPLHHVGGFSILARVHLSGSSCVHSTQRWQPQAFQTLCEQEKITLVSLVPAQVHDLVFQRVKSPANLRVAIIGGGGMSPELAAAARDLGWPVFQSYGMTEAASQIATQPLRGAGETFGELQVLPHWQVRQNQEGRLAISGVSLASGYADCDAEDRWHWTPLGPELITRDHVRLWDHAGHRWLSFVGREAGFVKILGELIHLAPLQARLDALALSQGLDHQPVIASLPDARRDSRLILVAENASAATLLDLMNQSTEPLCQLTEMLLVPSIPRTELGKVDTPALSRLLLDPEPTTTSE